MTEQDAPDEGFDLRALAAILDREYQAADNYHDSLYQLQRQAFAYYEGQLFGNEVAGRSQVVLPDVQESVDYMGQSVLRTFVSGEQVVEFEACCEEDEQAVGDATHALNYIFMRQQDGYRLLHDVAFDGLLKKIGIFKTAKETVEKVSRQTVVASEEELALNLPEGAEVESSRDNGDGTVTATIKTQRQETRFVDYAIPTTEFRFSPNARHEDEADYLCHVCDKTRSDLVDMGFDPEQVNSLPTSSRQNDQWRYESGVLDQYTLDESSKALELVELCEEYARIDVDGDGIAERVKVFRCGDIILTDAETGEPSIETVDDQPFSVFTPYPRPHRLVGWSLADKVMDIQLGRSYVARQLFDGMAFANMPRPVVDSAMADKDTYNDILSPIPGSPIRVRGGASAVQPFQTGFDVGKSLQVLEWITGERESRTGITRLNQGLDADALNKTATGTALMQSQGQQGEEMVARQLAEALSRLFMKKYRLMRVEAEPFPIKVDGQYRTVDPSQWPEDINVVVRVGLGSNSKDKRIQYRMALMQPLAEALGQGLAGPEHVYKWFDGMARDTGIGTGDDFVKNPETAPPEQEKPDPAMLELQAKQQEAQARLQLDTQKAEASIQTERAKAQAQLEAMREKAALDMQIAREKAAQEAELAREQMMIEAELSREQMRFKAATDAHIAQNRPGGALNA